MTALLVADGAPHTDCCGCWPVARTPHLTGYLRRRFVDTVAELDRLHAAAWFVLTCPACHQEITT